MSEAILDSLAQRAANYGGELGDILAITPVELWDSPTELEQFWADRDLSHVFPQSLFPELSNEWSNIVAEDSTLNRSRGDDIMSSEEYTAALDDAAVDAEILDIVNTDDSVEFLDMVFDLIA